MYRGETTQSLVIKSIKRESNTEPWSTFPKKIHHKHPSSVCNVYYCCYLCLSCSCWHRQLCHLKMTGCNMWPHRDRPQSGWQDPPAPHHTHNLLSNCSNQQCYNLTLPLENNGKICRKKNINVQWFLWRSPVMMRVFRLTQLKIFHFIRNQIIFFNWTLEKT